MPYTRDDCLFCKIVAGSIPADEVHRDDHVVAFRDINPQAPTHILLVPTTHYENAAEVAADDPHGLAALVVTARTLAEADGDRPVGLPAAVQHRRRRRSDRLPRPPAPARRPVDDLAARLTPAAGRAGPRR